MKSKIFIYGAVGAMALGIIYYLANKSNTNNSWGVDLSEGWDD